MEKVDVKCGFLCNNRCRFCVQGNKRSIHGDLDTDRILASLDEARTGCDQVCLTGGEVTIKPDFLRIVAHARDLGFSQIQIQSNGRMFADPGFCRETVAAGATEFSLALHGPTPELHDYLTRADGSFRQTTRGIRNLRALGQYVGTNTVITRSNYLHLPTLARLLIHLGVQQYQFAFVHALGTAGENFARIVPRMALVEPYVKQGLGYGRRAGLPVMTEAIPYCFMSGFEEQIAERIIPDTRIYDVDVLESYTAYRKTEGKQQGPNCPSCRYVAQCEGPWREYPEHYGWDEFVPVPASAA